MIHDLMYIELKTGYSDDGPAWIGYVKTSKSKKTIYFNNHAFQKYNGGYSNYVDIENGDEYWISGLKKRESNRYLSKQCHSHYAALHAHVALSRYTSSPKISRL